MRLYGNMIGNATPRPDWNQANRTAPDYIKNKPDVLLRNGGTMAGAIYMAGNYLTGLPEPEHQEDAATKGYVDSKRLSGTVTLSASKWSGGAQDVSVIGILATDMPHWGVVYGTNRESEKEAFALVDELETQAGKFVFRCFGDVPSVDLTIQWEVNR